MTAKDNAFFANAPGEPLLVSPSWARGLVDPEATCEARIPPSNPELDGRLADFRGDQWLHLRS